MDRPDIQSRLRLVSFAAITTLLAVAPTAYAAYISGSVTLFADFLRSTMECIAILLSWYVLSKISKSDESKFHYGFGKFEQLASLVIAGALLCTFMVCLFSGARRYFYPEPLADVLFGFVFTLLSVAGNFFLFLKNYLFWKRSPSPLMEAQWRLFRGKTVATIVVSISLVPAV
ncbi:MAG: cation transporter, partial [Bdellovibrionales bacterium]|nr:cation transporter [Bdellovibrionales bacterium]